MRKTLVALTALLALAGCSAEPAKPQAVAPAAAVAAASPRGPLTRSEPIRPYSEATRIELVVREEWDEDSKVLGRKTLTKPERERLEAALTREVFLREADINDPGTAAACFIPHHFFRYYDAAGKQIGELSVCLCCGGVDANPRVIPEGSRDYLDVRIRLVEKLVADMGLPTDVGCFRPPPARPRASSGSAVSRPASS